MKKITLAVIITLFVAGALFAFARNKEKISIKLAGGPTESRIVIIATLFPQYDFARAIAGDRANVTLLLPPGMESHAYEPTPADIARVGDSRVFFYTGDSMEPWVKRLTSGFEKSKNPLVVDVSQGIELSVQKHVYTDKADSEEHDDGNGHDVHGDPHVWTDPNNAMTMTKNILAALVAVDPQNAAYYRENASNYITELVSLDRDLKRVVASANRRVIVMGGRNAMYYFMKRYGLTAHSAFDSCSAEQEPSVLAITEIKDMITANDIRVIYYEELQEPRIARAVAEGTKAKLLLLHSLHNLSKDDFDVGKTYVSLMRQNLKNLEEGLR